MMTKRAVLCACACLGVLALCGNPANAQIAKVVDDSGRRFFINAEPPVQTKLMPAKSHAAIYMPAETTFTGRGRPAFSIDRDGAEKKNQEHGFNRKDDARSAADKRHAAAERSRFHQSQ